jgi:histidine ammonia-lyase
MKELDYNSEIKQNIQYLILKNLLYHTIRNILWQGVIMSEIIFISGNDLTIEQVCRTASGEVKVEISPESYDKIDKSREFIDKILDDGQLHYGINTGFGDFANVRISPEKLRELQVNLIRSHCTGVGEMLPGEVVRAMMLLRANTLCRGCSGIRRTVIQTLLEMLNSRVHPVVPSRGSVGASGDLAPLAHIALVIIGEGEAEYNGEVLPGSEALAQAGIRPVELMEKEGLALINGTQLMAGISCLAVGQMSQMLDVADALGSLVVEVLLGTDQSFRPEIQNERPHRGQIETASNIYSFLKDSTIVESHRGCGKVQDAYSLRCMPAVHGAAREGIRFARSILSTEINSSVDNPLVFPDEEVVLSGGNFHGAPVALILETLAVSLSFVANISERRIERMLNPHYSGLPAFLAMEGGLNSGLMIAQYTAAALASENKVLCHPACCDTIPTSAGQEDHVSMGSISALKLLNILNNTWNILAIESLCAAQAAEFRSPSNLAPATGRIYDKIRKAVPVYNQDRVISSDIKKIAELIKHEDFIENIKGKVELAIDKK